MSDLQAETDRLLALADAATPGRWFDHGNTVWAIPDGDDEDSTCVAQECNEEDAILIASAHDMADQIRALQAEVNRLTERDQRLMTKLGTFKPCGDPEIDAVLGQDDPEWRAWVDSMPDQHWSRYDLSAMRLGWHFGRKALKAENDALRNKARAFRNRLTQEIAQHKYGDYELRRAEAEHQVNEFEKAFDLAMSRLRSV